MNRLVRRFAVASTLASVLLGGCANEQETLVVLYAVAWGGAGDCSVATSSSVLNNGTLDTSFGTGFVAPLLVANQQDPTSSTSASNTGIDKTEVQLSDADVSISIPQSPEIESALAAQNGAFLDFNAPLQSISIAGGGQQGIIVEVLTPPAVQALNTQINDRFDPGSQLTLVADITINAKRSGNTAGNIGVIEARTFSYPITVCSGCLVDCSSCPNGACPVESTNYEGGVCNNAQDFPLTPSVCMN